MAWLPTAVTFVFMPVIKHHKMVEQPNDSKAFYNFLYMTLILAGFLMIMIIVQKCFNFSKSEYYVTSTFMLLLLIILPLIVVIMEEKRISKNKNGDDSNIAIEKNLQARVERETTQNEPLSRGEDHTILQAIFSLDMLTLFVATICGLGGTLTVVNNLSQIGLSLGYPAHSITTFLSLMAIWI
jgi:uncharacterized membrane protein